MVKAIKLSILALCAILASSLLTQVFSGIKTNAANTLSGTDNEIIQITTTDGLPVNQPVTFDGVSSDGNIVLFESAATNLPSQGGTNYAYHGGIYIHNITSGTTERVDVSSSGALANQLHGSPLVSENGRYILFMSRASNLIDGQTQYPDQLYVRDIQAGTTIATSNHYSNMDAPDIPLGISNDGRFVLAGSRYINSNAFHDMHAVLGDATTGTYTWKTLETASGNTLADFNAGGMSCDGSIILYDLATNTIPKDLRNTTSTGNPITTMHGISPIISCNGDYMLYATTDRTDISPTPAGMSQYMHLVEYNRLTGDRRYIDSNSSGSFDNNHLTYSVGSYASQPPNVFSASIADTGDVVLKYNGNFYLKHLSDGSGTLESVAKNPSGAYINVSTQAKITSNGRYIFFTADPYDLGLTPSPSGMQIIRTKTNL